MTLPDPIQDPEARKARSRRNLALAGALLLFVVLVFIVTVIKMAGGSPEPHF